MRGPEQLRFIRSTWFFFFFSTLWPRNPHTLTCAQADMNGSQTHDKSSQTTLDTALTPGVVLDTNITLTGELFLHNDSF